MNLAGDLKREKLELYSEKCSHFYQDRKMGKKEIKKQKTSKGEALRGGLRPGQVLPGQESPVPEKEELHQSSRVERRSQGVRAGPQEGGDVLELPGTLTDTCSPRRVRRAP